MISRLGTSATSTRRVSTLAEKLRSAASTDSRQKSAHIETSSGSEVDDNGENFREMFVMPKRKLRTQMQLEQITGRSVREKWSRADIHDRLSVRSPRSKEMSTEQDWPSVWPAARTFQAATVPLPIRMGTRPDPEKRAPFKKQGNLELVKIPNFLHLTPAAIEKHCQAIKKFCTEFPPVLLCEEGEAIGKEEFPIKLSYNSYVHQGPNIRDNRSRVVTMVVDINQLKLSPLAKEKMMRLAGKRFNEKDNKLTIVTDRCHTRKQNLDYAYYLLTVLYHESNKLEKWEELKLREDNLKVEFEGSESQKKLVQVISKAINHDQLKSSVNLNPDAKPDEILKHPQVEEFSKLWKKYRNTEETAEMTREYGRNMRQLLGLPSPIEQPRH